MQKILSHIPGFLKNKYILTLLFFAVWMVFFDDRDIITTHFRYKKELRNLEDSKAYYQEQIAETRKELEQLKNDPQTLERYARERYRMKRADEDLYIIEDQ
ncbi:septum formation initiator family protein [Flavihumibacter sp. RY-1]|jgi:cell division protein FtsB|uniref:Septum formation initiator family protein n=1 Tax=Flavihumibacter fluminis TaxID=2909236 RepID=A0ABS9BQ90_9BACT|nr:septum formation initiator family protein [Flavihumibacter fluminis]MBU7577679.1 septum formation initiator family protein [Flavihumibacter sp.]MCF1716994.1 septum formation initiator family protein [Flavihumibacter fluminis]